METVAILGDLTDAKDHHPASLVNRVVKEITRLTRCGVDVQILMGNHDYLRAGHAFFDFLGVLPKVYYHSKIGETGMIESGLPTIWLPHTKSPAKDWAELDFSHYGIACMHQTITGAVASNGMKMESDGVFPRIDGPVVYSGDIHVPQTVAYLEYVGSPYHVHFGDNFVPRAVLLDKHRKAHSLKTPNTRRLSLKVGVGDTLRSLRLGPGDHVKLHVAVPRSSVHEWPSIRRGYQQLVQDSGAELHGVTMSVVDTQLGALRYRQQPGTDVAPTDDVSVLADFVRREELGADAFEIGAQLMMPTTKPLRKAL